MTHACTHGHRMHKEYAVRAYAPRTFVSAMYTMDTLVAIPSEELPVEDQYCEGCGGQHRKAPASDGWVRPPMGLEVLALKDPVLAIFRRHHAYTLVYYGLTFKAATKVVNLGKKPIDLTKFAKDDARSIFPALELHYDSAGRNAISRLGVSNTKPWNITNPHTQTVIRDHSFVICSETAATTSLQINVAIEKLRAELAAGALPTGFGPRELSKRISGIFNNAERYRADRIARTEAAMATEDGDTLAGKQSGVVVGYRPLLSPDACELCVDAASRWPVVSMEDAMTGVGQYGGMKGSSRKLPTYHPNCMCSKAAILDVDAAKYGLPVPESAQPQENTN